jgi:hypothetical protein
MSLFKIHPVNELQYFNFLHYTKEQKHGVKFLGLKKTSFRFSEKIYKQ